MPRSVGWRRARRRAARTRKGTASKARPTNLDHAVQHCARRSSVEPVGGQQRLDLDDAVQPDLRRRADRPGRAAPLAARETCSNQGRPTPSGAGGGDAGARAIARPGARLWDAGDGAAHGRAGVRALAPRDACAPRSRSRSRTAASAANSADVDQRQPIVLDRPEPLGPALDQPAPAARARGERDQIAPDRGGQPRPRRAARPGRARARLGAMKARASGLTQTPSAAIRPAASAMRSRARIARAAGT